MRLKHGGFTPKIAGRPTRDLVELTMPNRLVIDLKRGGLSYSPAVRSGEEVAFGRPLATVSAAGGTLSLPAPARGRVSVSETEAGTRVVIDEATVDTTAEGFAAHVPERVSREQINGILATGGVWPFLWSSRTRGIPRLDAPEGPRAIIVNFVLTEPFRARGRVIITRSWARIVAGIRFLQRMVSDYGSIEIVLTAPDDPVAKMIYQDLSGYALIHIHSVPLVYPIENPRILVDALRRDDSQLSDDDEIWVLDSQGVEALGACMSEGLPVGERVVVTGGPGQHDPKHYVARIGTPISGLGLPNDGALVLRGGLLTGVPVDPASESVGFDDDSFFCLPRATERETLSLIRPGFTRTSYNRSFASRLTGHYDSHITASLRGERRACIACGICENVCPAGIMPQVIHRYLHRGMTDEAAKSGLDLCVECNLCTYVCPSKIELTQQFVQAKQQISAERKEMLAVEARAHGANRTEEKS
ncbi:MAG TPA: 4Fe-4S dicluster domain-containing protein [Spirochaetia bacterium]|nr:4Fe-4S dicluster domain-containing protein [Spirochaetia bacterium]